MGRQTLMIICHNLSLLHKCRAGQKMKRGLTIAATVRPKTYRNLVAKLTSHFSPDERETSLQQLQTRKQQKDETYASLAAGIEKLTQKAYPQVDESVRNLIATRSFMDAILDGSIREKLRERMPSTLEKALKDVRQIAANKEVEDHLSQRTTKCKNVEEVRRLEEKLEKFEKDLTQMRDARRGKPRGRGRGRGGPPICFLCQMPGHVRRWCPFQNNNGGPTMMNSNGGPNMMNNSGGPSMMKPQGNFPGQTPKK